VVESEYAMKEESGTRAFKGIRTPSAQSGFVGSASGSPDFRRDIEGLRGLAVLLVVFYHAGVPGFSGGFVGVDVFFVLSGYLITGLLVKEIDRSGRLDLPAFYARRARRLLPAAALVIVATAAVSVAVFSPMEQVRIAHSALAAAAYVSNMWFATRDTDYFSAGSEANPLLHTWSLSVEEQFYVIWPLLVLLVYRGRVPRTRLVKGMIALAILSFAFSLWLTGAHPAWAFYVAPTRAWEFAVGAIAGLAAVGVLRRRVGVSRLLGWLGFLSIIAATILFSPRTAFPGTAALLPVMGTVAILVAGATSPRHGVGRLLDTEPLQRLGQLSYSWYLWHWPVLVIGVALVPDVNLAGRLALVTLALGLSALTFATVENPIRFHRRLSSRPAFSFGLAGVLTIAGCGVAIVLRQAAISAQDSSAHAAFVAAQWDRPTLGADCNANWGDDRAEECVWGDSASSRTLVLFGDSHAAHWFPALEVIAEADGWRLLTLTKNACPAAALPFNDPRSHTADECSRWRESAFQRIREIRPDAVVLGSATNFYGSFTDEEWRHGFEATLGALEASGTRSLVMWGNPSAPHDIPECLSRARVQRRNTDAACTFDAQTALDYTSYRAALAVADRVEGAVVVDVSSYFCDSGRCSPTVGGEIVVYDSHHITASTAVRLVPLLTGYLRMSVTDTAHGRKVGGESVLKRPAVEEFTISNGRMR
jgi:peptidoglycan/LPS O-acetylase OafA/YrhL